MHIQNRFKQPVVLLDALLHQHNTGKAVKVRHFRGNQELNPIADLRAFDYRYQVMTDSNEKVAYILLMIDTHTYM